MERTTNQRNEINYHLFDDIDASEREILQECMTRIMQHVDRNIEQTVSPFKVTRLLTIRWLINKNLQRADN